MTTNQDTQSPTLLHVDPADLAAIDPRDPTHHESVKQLVAKALELGGSAAGAVCLILAAVGTLAEATTDRAGVLTVAWQLIDEEIGEMHGAMRLSQQADGEETS